MDAEHKEILDRIFHDFSHENSLMIYLQQTQAQYGYVPPFAITYLSGRMHISESHIYGVITFYSQFSTKPVGKNIIKICSGTACHVGGSKVLVKKLKSYLRVDDENPTTEDRLFTVQNVACLGCCALAPAMMVNDKVYGSLDLDRMKVVIDGYRAAAAQEEV